MKKEQLNMFEELGMYDEFWKEHWQDMPEYNVEDKTPSHSIVISFESFGDVKEFSKAIGQPLTPATKSIWFPKKERLSFNHLRYIKQ